MIPDHLKDRWEKEIQRQEILFLANYGGYPDALARLSPDERLRTMRRLGWRVKEEFWMPDDKWEYTQRWARMTSGLSVCLMDGFGVAGVVDREGRRCGHE